MAKYFFDIDDGDTQTVDQFGGDYASREAVREAAIRTLPLLARDRMPNGDVIVIRVIVRDDEGRPIFHATLSLLAEWIG